MRVPCQHELVGPWPQVDGGNYVVTTAGQAAELLTHLEMMGGPFGLDTEFVGWSPADKRPIKYRAEIVCWSIAWVGESFRHPSHPEVPLCSRATLLATPEILEVFRPWLEGPCTKVAHDGFSVEYQVFANAGIYLDGLLDSLCLCKYVDNVPKLGHDLKRHMEETLGYEARSFKELFGSENLRTICEQHETHPLWKTLVDYAGLDAKAALELYYWAKPQCEELGLWDHFQQVWTPQQWVLTTLDSNGWEYDPEVAHEAISEYHAKSDQLSAELDAWACWLEPYPKKYMRGALRDDSGEVVQPRGWYPLHWVPRRLPLNPRSPDALAHFLYGRGTRDIAGQVVVGKGFAVPELCGNFRAVKKTRRGKTPTDEVALATIASYPTTSARDAEMLGKLNEYRKTLNLIGKLERFTEAALEEPDGRLRTQFKCRTDTGRLSAGNQPWQQVPKGGPMRRAFVAAPGHKLVVADFSGLEMRILAHFLEEVYGDTGLREDILAADVHSATALRVWGRPGGPLEGVPVEAIKDHPEYGKYRDYAKIINYAINYGKGAEGLGVQIQDSEGRPIGTAAAQALLDDYLAHAYPVIREWQTDLELWGRLDLGIRTLHGRLRKLPGLALDKNDRYEKWRYLEDYRRALNTPIQGSAADLVIMAMLACNPEPLPALKRRKYVNWALLALGVKMIAQVHDELVFEVPEENAEAARDEIKRSMESAQRLNIPTPVDIHICNNWAEGK